MTRWHNLATNPGSRALQWMLSILHYLLYISPQARLEVLFYKGFKSTQLIMYLKSSFNPVIYTNNFISMVTQIQSVCLQKHFRGQGVIHMLFSAKPDPGHTCPIVLCRPISTSMLATASNYKMKKYVNLRMEKKIMDWVKSIILISWLKEVSEYCFSSDPILRGNLALAFDNHHLWVSFLRYSYRFLLNNSLKMSSHDDRSKESLKWRTKVTTCQARHEAWCWRGQQ